MKKWLIGSVSLVAAVAAVQLLAVPPQKEPAGGKAALIARGKYLVSGAGVCNDCHTPMDQRGQPVPGKELQGTPLSFTPKGPVPGWVDKAPNIAGLPGWTDEQAIKFLMTGLAYNDLPAGPPMPQFRYNRADATAIVAYLRSLKSAPGATLIKSGAAAKSPGEPVKPTAKKSPKVIE